MTATNSPGDKFVLLFTTGGGDLSQFRDTFTDYYNVPPSNIKEVSGCSSYTSEYESLATQINGHVPAGDVPPGMTKSNTLFVIIEGDADAEGIISGTDKVSWENVRKSFDGEFIPFSGPPVPSEVNYFTGCEVNVVCVTPNVNALKNEWDLNISLENGTLMLVNNIAGDLLNTTDKTNFITAWNDLMRLTRTDALNAERLVTMTGIANDIHGASIATFFVKNRPAGNTDPFYPGRFRLLIRDGNHPGIGLNWWNSPDIWIENSCYSNEGNNRYMVGENNDIKVRVTNEGAHPLRPCHIGSTVFPYPFSSVTGDAVSNDSVDNVLKAGETLIHTRTYDFPPLVDHRCIRSLIHHDTITIDLGDPSNWDPVNIYPEAQKNITPAPVSCTGGGGEAPGGGNMPAPVPPENPEDPPPDPEGAGEDTLDNIRNFREMELLIENPFREKRTFKLIIPPLSKKTGKLINTKLFSFNEKSPVKTYPVKIKNDRTDIFTFTLYPGQHINLMAYISVKKGVKEFKRCEIPMELLVQRKKLKTFFRTPVFRRLKKYASIAGISFDLVHESVSPEFEIMGRDNEPAEGAVVFMSTVNGRQAAKILTGKDGKCRFSDINPGAYKVWAFKGRLISGPYIINAYPVKGKPEPYKILLGRKDQSDLKEVT